MIDCPNGEVRDLLPELLHGRLAPAEREIVEAHVRDCSACRAELELLGGMRRAMSHTPRVAVADIVRALPAYRAPARRSRGAWRIAAAVTLLAGGGATIVVARDARQHAGDGGRVAVAPSRTASTAPATVGAVGGPDTSAEGGAALTTPGAQRPRELAVAAPSVGDLNEDELNVLVNDLESLDAVTPAEVDHAASVSPIPPSSPAAPSGAGA